MRARLATTTPFLIAVIGAIAVAQDVAPPDVTLEMIMADPDWISRPPENPIWSTDSKQVYFRRKRKGTDVRDWFRVAATGGKVEKVPLKELSTSVPASGDETLDHSRMAFTRDGDVFIQNLSTGTQRQLTRTSASESGVSFLAGEQRVQFRRDGVLLIRDLRTGLESEPVVVRFDDPPPEDDPKAQEKEEEEKKKRGYVAEQEHDLFEYLQREEALRNAAKKADHQEDLANTRNVDRPVYLGKGLTQVSQTLARNARWLALVVTKAEPGKRGRADQMPVWVRDDGYVENRPVRSLVGDDPESSHQLKLIDLRTRNVADVDLSGLPDLTVDRLAWLKKPEPSAVQAPDASPTPAASEETVPSQPPVQSDHTQNSEGEPAAEVPATDTPDQPKPAEPAKPRPFEIETVRFSDDSQSLLIQCYSHDNKDRWIVRIDPARAAEKDAVTVIHHRFDEAWIGQHDYATGWIRGTRTTWFVSESSGFAHLSVADEAGAVRQLTSGSFEVSDVRASRDGSRLFFKSNETHPGVFEFCSVDLATGERRQLTTLGGVNDFVLSRDETAVAALHSEALKPEELFVVSLSGADQPRQLTRTISKPFRDIAWTAPKFVEVPSRHGGVIHSRVYLPEDATPAVSSSDPRPAVMFVHGAGYLQNAHQGWSGYFREFMFHTLLTRRGFVVLDMDYRASAGYGRDWRTAIYRQMGTPEVEDLADGVAWLAANHNVDAKRVGVYGGSYGGFLTLMSLFREPDLFAAGAALRPVTDWAHYNHGYTSNILNTPDVDPDAYNLSSPILFADGLTRPLLICHGMIDDNVFFKDTVRLTQRLIELKKDNWSVAMYPVEPHGFRQPASWRDEYQRILDLFVRELLATPTEK